MTIIEEIVFRLREEKGLGSKRRTELEAQLYELIDDPSGKKATKESCEYLRRRFGLPFTDMKYRLTLRLANAPAEPFWDLLDDGSMCGATAVRLLREARMLAKQKESRGERSSLEFEVEEAIARWEEHTVTCRDKATGRTWRRKKPSNGKGPDVHEALGQIRQVARDYADRRAPTLDTRSRRRIVDEVIAEVNAVLASLLLRLQREEVKARQHKYAEPSKASVRRDVQEACDILGIATPTPTRPIDLSVVRSRFRELVKRYHPDVTKTEQSRELYEAVVKARETLENHEGARS